MALVDLKSNLANFRSDFKTIDLETRFVNPKSSTFNIDSIPEPVSKQSKLAVFSRKLISSLLDIDDIPNKFSPGEIYRPSRYAIQKIVNASRFNIDSLPKKFSTTTKYTPSKYAEESKLPITTTRWSGANGKAAEAVNYISDTKFGLRAFVTNFTDPNTSQFLGVAGAPLQNKFDYPETILGNRLMKPARSAAFPGPQNFIDDIKFGATGFTTNLGKSGLAEKSQFLGISGAPGNEKYSYPGDKLLQGNRLMKPGFSSQQFDRNQYSIEQDFLSDKYASGFTTNMNLTTKLEKSQFKGISGLSFTLPDTYIIPDTKSTGPTGWQPGSSTLISQLGTGIPNLIKSYDSLITSTYNWYTPGGSKNAYHSGFHDKNRYSVAANINSTTERGFLAATYNTNSPIDDVYKKYNLHNDEINGGAFNPSYIKQPYILRGIQRKGNEKVQYWGFGSKSGFDDGLIRGGVVTVADRIVADTVRIAKWMASPKGLLWIVKQIGLGLTNPKVEAVGGVFGRVTRIHLGVTSLLSVPGTALGLHFTRHGIPFLNEIASYENVIKIKQTPGIGNPKYSRLGNLLDEFAIKLPKTIFEQGASFIKIVKSKTILNSLSGLAGAQSVYGIGSTSIRRVVDTRSDAVDRAQVSKFNSSHSDDRPYVSELRAKGTSNGMDNLPSVAENTTVEQADSLYNRSLKHLWTDSVAQKFKSFKPIYKPIQPVNGDIDSKRIVEFTNLEKPIYYVGAERAKTGKLSDVPKESTAEGLTDTVNLLENVSSLSLKQTYDNLSTTNQNERTLPIANNTTFTPNPFNRKLESDTVKDIAYPPNTEIGASPIDQYITLAYNKIPNKQDKLPLQDFRSLIYSAATETPTPGQLKQLGTGVDTDYYGNGPNGRNLETAYGFGNQGATAVGGATTPARGKGSFLREGKRFATGGETYGTQTNKDKVKANHNRSGRFILARNPSFRGDKITAIDIGSSANKIELSEEIYDKTTKDLIKFWFEDGDTGLNVMPFRATLTGLSDSFSPGWTGISIMGRPDGAALYSSFERAISFEFKVAALSRSEMIPMWRKLNYLASYTMPDYNVAGTKPSGPFMRLTIGDLYFRCPGYLTSLTYTFPEDSSWDIADDFDLVNNADAKQLPMAVDVSVSYTIVNEYRPQTMGRVYSLSPYGLSSGINGQWLADAEGVTPVKLTAAQIARNEKNQKIADAAAADALKESETDQAAADDID